MSAVVAVKFSSIAIMSTIADATSARAEAMSTCDATIVRTTGTKKKKNQSTIKRQNEEEKKDSQGILSGALSRCFYH